MVPRGMNHFKQRNGGERWIQLRPRRVRWCKSSFRQHQLPPLPAHRSEVFKPETDSEQRFELLEIREGLIFPESELSSDPS